MLHEAQNSTFPAQFTHFAQPAGTPASLLRYPLITGKENICYISWTVDAYEGIGFLRTDDASEGRISLFFTEDYRAEIEELLDALAAEGIKIERLPVEVCEE